MEFYVWNGNLSVGNTFIDNDHRHLIALLNNLYSAMGEGRGPDVLGPVLNDLIQYTRAHFKREEDVMQGMCYAGFLEHKAEHDKLTTKVFELQKQYIAGEASLSVELLMFLYDWLFEHIMKVDKKLAQAIRKRPEPETTTVPD